MKDRGNLVFPTKEDLLARRAQIQKGVEHAQKRHAINLIWWQIGDNIAALKLILDYDNQESYHLTEVISESKMSQERMMKEEEEPLSDLVPPPIILKGKITPEDSITAIYEFINDYYREVSGLPIKLRDFRGNLIELPKVTQKTAV